MVNPLEILNITKVSDLSTAQIVTNANQILAIPDLIILFVFYALMFLIIGLIIKKHGGKFSTMWIFSTLVTFILLIFLILNPNVIADFSVFIQSFFKG